MTLIRGLFIIVLAIILPKGLQGQCDTPPTASMSVSSFQGCGSGTIAITFTHNGDDDDSVTIRYRIGGSSFTLNNTESGVTVSHTITPPVTVTLISVTVTEDDDDTCSSNINQSVNISAGSGPNLNTSTNNPACGQSNGSISAQATGGTSPYQYSIGGAFQNSGTFNNLAAGSYTVTVRDANGCETSRTVTLNTSATPTLTATVNAQPACGQSNGSISAQATGGTSPYQYSIGGAFQNSGTFNNLAAGSYTVTVRDASGCETSRTVTLNTSATPTLTATVSAQPACGQSNGSISAQATGGTSPYQYRLNTGNFQAAATFNNLAAGSYTVTVRDASGCETSRTVILNASATPTLTATVTAQPACGQSNGSISAQATGGTSPYQYRLNTGNFQAAATFNNLAAGSYTVTVRDASGCETSRTVILNTSATPTLTATVSAQPACGQSNGSISAQATGGTSPYQYRLNTGNFQTAATFNNLAAGSYTVTVRDANGCETSRTVTLNTSAAPTLTATVTAQPACGQPNGSISAQATGGTSPYQYSIGGTFQNSGTFNNLAAGSYTVTVRDASGCETSRTVILNTSAAPTLTATVTAQPACGQSNGSISAQATGGTSPYQYRLNTGNFQATATFNNLAAGSYTITVRDASGCETSRTVTLNASATPTLTATVTAQPACGQSNGSISAQATGGTSPYQYRLNTGNFQATATFNNLAAGSYTVTVRDANGCESTRTVTLNASATPTLTATVTAQPACGQSNGSISAQATGGTSPYQYRLNTGNFQATATFNNLAAGSYTVTVRDANGCETSRTVILNASAAPTLTATVTAQPACGQSNGSISAQATGGASPYQYRLNIGNFQAAATFNNLAAGSYTVTVRDASGCETSRTVILNTSATPTLTATVTAQPTCGQTNGSISAQATGGASPYQYRLNTGNFQTAATFNNLAAGSYTVTVRDANGCETSRTVILNTSAAPTLTATVTAQPACGQTNGSISAQATGGTSPYQYRLNTGNFQAAATFNNLAAGSYTVTVRDANGCESTRTVILETTSNFTLNIANIIQPSCRNKNGRFTVVVTGGDTPFTYSVNGGAFGNNGNFSNLEAGQYTVRVRDNKNCEKSITIELKDASSDFIDAQITSPSNNLQICPTTVLNLTANLPQGTTGTWSSIPAGLRFTNLNRNTTTVTNPPSGQHKLIWTLSTTICPNYSSSEVEVLVLAKPTIKDDLVNFTSTTKTIDILGNDTVESAFFMDIVKEPTQGDVVVQADNTIIYTPSTTAKGEDSFTYEICLEDCPLNCDTAIVTIELPNQVDPCNLEIVDQSVIFPEGITPNDDRINDNLIFQIVDKIGCPTNYAKSDITVFNRWNDKVFVQEPYENQWNGHTQGGESLPAGVYYYVLRVKREDKKDYLHFGSITIFR